MSEAQNTKLQTKRDEKSLSVTFTPFDGEAISVSLSDLPEEIVQRLALYGLSVKVQRAVSGKDTGIASTVEAVVEALKEGKWNVAPAQNSIEQARQVVIDTAKALPPELREQYWQALESQGTADKLRLTREDLGL